jgi:hypothetical protein
MAFSGIKKRTIKLTVARNGSDTGFITNGMNGSSDIVHGALSNPFTTANFIAELNRRAMGGQPIVGFVDDEVSVVCGQTGDADGYCGCFQSA